VTEPATPVVQPRRAGNALNILLAVAALIAVGGVAFAVGRFTAPASAAGATNTGRGGFFNPNASFQPGQGPRASGGPGGFGGFGGLAASGAFSLRGTVTSITPTSLTLRLENGNSITVGLDTSTTYHQQAAASASSVKSGQEVIVQLNGRGGFGGQGGPNASPQPGASTGSSSTIGPARDVTIATP
jgi:hypothetical protein